MARPPVTGPARAEQGRHDAQRHALSGLLARFTADRDALITSIHDCQERIAQLVARVDGGVPAQEDGGETVALAPPANELRAALEELRLLQERRLAEIAVTAASAVDKADAALGTVLSTVQQLQAPIDISPAPSEHDLAQMREALSSLQDELARIQLRIDEREESQHEAESDQETDVALVRSQVERVASDVEALRADLARSEKDVASLEAGFRDTLRERLGTLEQGGGAAAAELWPAIESLRNDLSRMESTMGNYFETTISAGDQATGDLTALREQLDRLASELTRTSSRAARAEELGAAVADVRGDLARMESTLAERLEARVRASADGWQTEARALRTAVQQLSAAGTGAALGEIRTALEQLRGDVGRVQPAVEARVEARLRVALEAWNAEARLLRERVERLGASQADPAPLAAGLRDVRGAVEQLRGELARAEARAEAKAGATIDARLRAHLEAARAEAKGTSALRALLAALSYRLAMLQAVAAWVPGMRLALWPLSVVLRPLRRSS